MTVVASAPDTEAEAAAQLPHFAPLSGSDVGRRAWAAGWQQYLHYRGDPVQTMSQAGVDDEEFVMGPVFAAVYRLLGASAPTDPTLRADLERARVRRVVASAHEQAHVDAVELFASGEFTAAAQVWDRIAAEGLDFAAVRFAHDVYLHVGDAQRRLTSSRRAVEMWQREAPGWGYVLGLHAFSLEEVGRYDEAEEIARVALRHDPDDLWARHALAHVYESTDDSDAALELLETSAHRWSTQDLLATHIWWHLALRLIAVGNTSAALEIFDERRPHVTTAFSLCDLTSLLWRLELAEIDVGDRWDAVADVWNGITERHTCGFVDAHAVLAFVRRGSHRGAAAWFDGLQRGSRSPAKSENDEIFEAVVKPLAGALSSYAQGDGEHLVQVVDGLGSCLRRIGGSIAQRDLINLTCQSVTEAT